MKNKLINSAGVRKFKKLQCIIVACLVATSCWAVDFSAQLNYSQKFSISEIAGMLGYCDAQYFRKKFKDFYHVCPTDYIKSIIG